MNKNAFLFLLILVLTFVLTCNSAPPAPKAAPANNANALARENDPPDNEALDSLNSAVSRARAARQQAIDLNSPSLFPRDWEAITTHFFVTEQQVLTTTLRETQETTARYYAMAEAYEALNIKTLVMYSNTSQIESPVAWNTASRYMAEIQQAVEITEALPEIAEAHYEAHESIILAEAMEIEETAIEIASNPVQTTFPASIRTTTTIENRPASAPRPAQTAAQTAAPVAAQAPAATAPAPQPRQNTAPETTPAAAPVEEAPQQQPAPTVEAPQQPIQTAQPAQPAPTQVATTTQTVTPAVSPAPVAERAAEAPQQQPIQTAQPAQPAPTQVATPAPTVETPRQPAPAQREAPVVTEVKEVKKEAVAEIVEIAEILPSEESEPLQSAGVTDNPLLDTNPGKAKRSNNLFILLLIVLFVIAITGTSIIIIRKKKKA